MSSVDRSYTGVGFNRFFRRSISSNQNTTTLSNSVPISNGSTEINFDKQQVSGALGDIFRIGKINLDGKLARISLFDERNNEIMRLGDLGDE